MVRESFLKTLFCACFDATQTRRFMQKLNLNLSESLTQEQKAEAYFDTTNQKLVVALAVNPKFFEELSAQLGEFIKSNPDALFADNARALTLDGIQLFIKDMRDDFKIINSEDEFKMVVKEER